MTEIRAVMLALCPHARADIVDGLVAAMPRLVVDYAIATPLRQAHFLAQCAHESAGFQTTVEYASGADYEGRHDLGNTEPGDGRRFKGRGLIQTTGRANYRTDGAELGLDLCAHPELAAAFPAAALLAGVYWRKHKINALADRDDLVAVTRAVNGGRNGLESRADYLRRAKAALANGGYHPAAMRKSAPATAVSAPKPAPAPSIWSRLHAALSRKPAA